MNIRQLLDQRVSAALTAAGAPAGSPALVQYAARPEFGDYQANGVMGAAKQLKTNPRQLAQAVLEKLDLADVAESVEIAGPGFLNIRLRSDWLTAQLKAAAEAERLGVTQAEPAQTVVVDYSGPNLAKEMHVGHLRSTIIGDAVVRVLEFLGHKVIRQNHVGDWGTQFGMLIAYMVRLRESQGADLSTELADLEGFYRDAKRLYDEDAEFARQAREYVVRLQGGDVECLALWQVFINESLQHCEEVYQRLDVSLQRADVQPESSYNDDLPVLLTELQDKGLARESEGAQCVFLPQFTGKDGTPLPVIVQKSDGGYLYATTDLAALRYRAHHLHADRMLYFVDARQSLHLNQVFAVARAAGWVGDEVSLEHLPFGTMMGADGKPFKTRSGGTVKLIELLQEAEERAAKLVAEKNPELAEATRREIALAVGIGAVKYADLSKNRTSDYIFNWDTMLSLDGNTAPYLQYAYTRIRSIFRKGELEGANAHGALILQEPAERILALKLAQFEEVLVSVGDECVPHVLCGYLYDLAGAFMSFYETCPVLKAEAALKSSRLALCGLTAETVKTGLGLLGIGVMEQM
jgi:arginyl-tRNA synthetase